MTVDFSRAWKTVQGMVNGFIASLPNLLLALLVFLAFYLAARGVRNLVRRLYHTRWRRMSLGILLGRLTQAVVIGLGMLVALVIAIPSFRPGQLIELLGVSSVAIGFAFRDILQNFLGGILLLWTEPFHIDDQIIVGGFEGTVEEIQTRATMIRTYDGRRIVIPNAKLFMESVIVNTASPARRIEYDIGIGTSDDVARAKALILEVLTQEEGLGLLKDPAPDVLLFDLAASSVVLRVRWWIEPPRKQDALASRDAVLTAIKRKLTENGIDLPFPTQQILFHDQTEETDGDRAQQREGWPAGQGPVPRPRSIVGAIGRLPSSGPVSR